MAEPNHAAKVYAAMTPAATDAPANGRTASILAALADAETRLAAALAARDQLAAAYEEMLRTAL